MWAPNVIEWPIVEYAAGLADLAGMQSDSGLPDLSTISPDAPAMLQYTSGTTGDPRGVLLRHLSLVNNAKMTMDVTEAKPGSMCLNPLPMFHTAPCIISTLGPLCLGGGVVLVEQFMPDAVLDLRRDEEVSILFFVPTVLGALIEAQRGSDKPHRVCARSWEARPPCRAS